MQRYENKSRTILDCSYHATGQQPDREQDFFCRMEFRVDQPLEETVCIHFTFIYLFCSGYKGFNSCFVSYLFYFNFYFLQWLQGVQFNYPALTRRALFPRSRATSSPSNSVRSKPVAILQRAARVTNALTCACLLLAAKRNETKPNEKRRRNGTKRQRKEKTNRNRNRPKRTVSTKRNVSTKRKD